jgi:hypothetical protein
MTRISGSRPIETMEEVRHAAPVMLPSVSPLLDAPAARKAAVQ